MKKFIKFIFPVKFFIIVFLFYIGICQGYAQDRPNVILIMTDDQGYGDIAAHGHPHLKTPNMDRLREMSVRLENFHVDPTCSPTRSALMTGRYSGRVGVWHTVMGRNMLREDETTLADVFSRAGYRTGIFGKWHLGDTYPYGAKFRGFDDAIVHYAGGVGQTPDFWGNDYFEDHYNDNGQWRRFQGYCTDVWFREALRFIRESRDQPFFLYLPTNAAHQTRPHVPERYKALYEEVDEPDRLRIFWGMVTNIDDNLGVMMDRLEHWGLLENTILIFMGDNGTTMGPGHWPAGNQRAEWSGRFNAGMRGSKGSHYDGGHRVFSYIYYPAAGIRGGRDVNHITAHIDLMPTLLELTGIGAPDSVEFDGKSLVPLLTRQDNEWPERTLFVQNQRVLDPIKWKDTSVMTDRWRLVNNTELYDMHQDQGQLNNVIENHPDVADRLRIEYEEWWDDISRRFDETTPLYIGAEQQNPVQLNAHDWMSAELPPWNQPHIVERQPGNGPWRVQVANSGLYTFVLRERPEVANFPLRAAEARLRIGDHIDETKTVNRGETGVRFEVELEAGPAEIKTWLIEDDGTSRGAYYVDVFRLND
jgi:arylsulfatase A-like enzyme